MQPQDKRTLSYVQLRLLPWMAGIALALSAAVPLLVWATDANDDNLDDAWEAQFGITTNAYDPGHLVGWWQMQSNPTNSVVDSSTNQINGTLTNFPASPFGSGLFGSDLNFSTNGQVNFPTNAAFGSAANQFTFSAWFQTTNTASQPATIATWSDANTNSWTVGADGSGLANVTFSDASGNAQTFAATSATLYDGSWHQVAVTFDATYQATVYVDGQNEASGMVTNWASGTTGSFTLGVSPSTSTNQPYALDDTRLYDRAFAANEITQLPVTYYDLNGTGLSVYEDYLLGLNPISSNQVVTSDFLNSGLESYYGSNLPVLNKTGGDTQVVAQSTFASNALTVQVTDGSGNPLTGAPITFALSAGSDGGLAQTSGGTTVSSISLVTDGSGNATVYYQSGADVLKNNTITATAVTQAGNVTATFTEYCGIQNGLVSWLDADTGVTADGSNNVSQWQDESPSGANSATQTTSGIQPQLVSSALAGHSVIQFDGASTYLSMPPCIADDFTMVVVFRSTDGSNTGGQWWNAGGVVDAETAGVVNDFGMSLDQNGDVLTGVGNPDTTQSSLVGGYNDGRAHIATFVRKESTSWFGQFVDSAYQGGQTNGNTSSLNSPPQITIGATQTLANYFGGDVAEVLLYTRKLSSTEREAIEGFLADKYQTYSPYATWPAAYSTDVQEQITAFGWDKAQADAYVTFTSGTPPVPASGLLLWLTAKTGVTADGSGNVQQWVDQSPAGHVVPQSTQIAPPVTGTDANGNPCLTFNGSQALIAPDYIPANGDLTIIAVAADANPTGNFGMIETLGGLSPINPGQTRSLADNYGSQYFDAYFQGTSGGATPNAGEQVLSALTYQRSSGNTSFYLRGDLNGTGNTSVNDLGSGLFIGDAANLACPWNGTISSILVYNRILSDSERNAAEAYLADQFGVFHPDATWPLSYPEDIQELIYENEWNETTTQAYIASLDGAVDAPTPYPAGGRYSSAQTITVTSATSDALIFYTTDGSTPTTNSHFIPNGGTLEVSATTQYRFMAADGVNPNSAVISDLYQIGGSGGSLAAGDDFTMALKPDGSVWTWGDDWRGEQGDNGANNPAAFPVSANGLSGVTNIAASGDHALAVTSDGSVWVWGADDESQCGDGGTSDLLVPTQLTSLSNITSVYAAADNGFAVDNSGNLYGWGDNSQGQLGDGTTNSESTPEAITSVTSVVQVAASPNFTLALKTDGTVWAVGNNDNGELGDGTQNDETAFQQVPGLSNIVGVAVGWEHALALDSSGSVWSWGYGGDGELGHSSYNSLSSPQRILGIGPAVAVVAVDRKSFIILADGTIRCFGGNGEGELGLGFNGPGNEATPTSPTGVRDVTMLAAGTYHTVVGTSKGALFGFGENSSCRLTQEFSNSSFNSPNEVHDPLWQQFTSVTMANSTTIALRSDGTVWASGSGSGGTLGNGAYDYSQRPVQVQGAANIVQIFGGLDPLAIDNSGNLWVWGGNWDGQLGLGNYDWPDSATEVPGVANVTWAASGDNHALIVESDGSVWASGDDSQGELGDGTTNQETSFIEVTGVSDASQVAAGTNTSFVLDSEGAVWAWGQNDSGQLGLGSTGNVASPTQITGLPAMASIAAFANNAVGIDTSGNVWTWGTLGNSDGTPVEQSGVSGVIAASAGTDHSVVLQSDGTVWGIGSDGSGQLDDPSYGYDGTFTQFSGVSGATAISAQFYDSTLVVKQDGTIAGFGDCFYGELAGNLGFFDPSPRHLYGISMLETAPTVSITSPTSETTAEEGTNLSFQASASASTGAIAKVEYYLNGVQIGTSTTPGTWDFTWTPTTYGQLTFEAVAVDTSGAAQISTPVTVTVGPNVGPAAPTNVVVTPGPSGTAYITWTNSSGATSILIQVQNPDGSWTTVATLTDPSQISYAINDLDPDQNYTFQVVESNGGGSSSTTVTYNAGTSYSPLTLTKVGDDPPVVANNTFESNPLTVVAQTSAGAPIQGASVTFSMASGSSGALATSSGGTTASSQTVTTNAQGQASVYYESGADGPLPNDQITAATTSGTTTPTVSFEYGVPGLVTWLAADSNVTTDGSGNVTGWGDLSPNAYPFTPVSSSAETQLVTTTDGHQALQFAGFDALANSGTVTTMSAVTVFTVASPSGGGEQINFGTGAFGFGFDANTQATFNLDGNEDDGYYVYPNDSGAITTPSEPWTVSTFEFNFSAHSGTCYDEGFENGTLSGELGGGFRGGGGTSTNTFTIGYANAPDYPGYSAYSGELAEVLVFNGILTDAQRAIVENYLENKYNSHPPVPTVAGNSFGAYNVGVPFSYTISASLLPTSYTATGLPTGVSVNTSTGVISGAATQAGTYNVVLSATNSGGTGTVTVPLIIYPAQPPTITSAVTFFGTVGQSLTGYQIAGSNLPTSYGASGLPDGLSVNSSTGFISGTPTSAGTSTFTVTAANAYGVGSTQVTFTVYDTVPVTSGLVAWLHADSGISTDNGYVTQWADQSGNGYNVTQSNNPNQPQLTTDPHSLNPVVTLSGSQFLATTAQLSGVTDVTIIAVASDAAEPSPYYFPELVNVGGDGLGSNQDAEEFFIPDGGVYGGSSNLPNFGIHAATYSASTGTVNFYWNGAPNGSGTAGTQTSPVGANFIIGNDSPTPDPDVYGFYEGAWIGNVGDVIVFNRVLSDSELQQVTAYLASKYNIGYSLPAPTISPNGGSSSTVTISTLPPVEVHYTLDGSVPTESSPLYTGTITLTQSCPLTCAYFINGFEVSPTATAQFYVGDTDDIGISDAWQIEYFGSIGIDPNALAPGGSGLTNLQAYLWGYDPNDYSTNGDGLSDLVNHQLGYAGDDTDINGDGLTNAQDLALGIDPFDPDPNPPPSGPPAGTPGDTVPPTITLTSPEGATLLP